MAGSIFEWERPLVELESRIRELQAFTDERGIDLADEIATLRARADSLRAEIFQSLSPWQRVQLARHPQRPTTLEYIELIFDDFLELYGDRSMRNDEAMVGGIAMLDDIPVTVIGPQKGRDTKENIRRNFGLPHPEGYRKALRLMQQAEKFGRPIISLIDVVGAFPGIEAEQRGQGVAIAENIRQMSFLRVPIVCVITGEGGSGGALAIGVGDRVLMQENAWYSVISPEMCAEILWKDTAQAQEAAAVLKLGAHDLLAFDIVDEVIGEPMGGAHRDKAAAAGMLKEALLSHLRPLLELDPDTLVEQRLHKYRKMGRLEELTEAQLQAVQERKAAANVGAEATSETGADGGAGPDEVNSGGDASAGSTDAVAVDAAAGDAAAGDAAAGDAAAGDAAAGDAAAGDAAAGDAATVDAADKPVQA